MGTIGGIFFLFLVVILILLLCRFVHNLFSRACMNLHLIGLIEHIAYIKLVKNKSIPDISELNSKKGTIMEWEIISFNEKLKYFNREIHEYGYKIVIFVYILFAEIITLPFCFILLNLIHTYWCSFSFSPIFYTLLYGPLIPLIYIGFSHISYNRNKGFLEEIQLKDENI